MKNMLFVLFQTFFVDFSREINEKVLKSTKRLKAAKKVVPPAFGCMQHSKAVRNTQQKTLKRKTTGSTIH